MNLALTHTLDIADMGEASHSHVSEEATRERKAMVRAGLIPGDAGGDRRERSARLADDIKRGVNYIKAGYHHDA